MGAAPHGTRAVVLFGVFAAGCIATYALDAGPGPTAAAFLGLGLTGCAALLVGPRLHRAHTLRPWTLFAAASAFFLVGTMVRPWAVERSGLAMAAADAFSVPAYLFLLLGMAALLRARDSFDRHAVADGLIVSVGAGLLSAIVFAFPAARVVGRPELVSVAASLYPLLDVMLLLLLVNLAFTTAVRQPSFSLLAAATAALLVGDVGYAVIGRQGELSGPIWMDLPYLIAYALIGASALHPSMVELGRAVARPVQAWSWRRLFLLAPALAVPLVLLAGPGRTGPERVVLAVGAGLMIVVVLLRALERSELRVAYQPIVRLPEGDVVGAEALVRWDHPVRGPIPPATFIPVAEETGLIGAIGAWVLAEAVRTTARWRQDGTVPEDFWMSVNVSPRQLRDDLMPDLVRTTLDGSGLPPSAPVLEITESVMLDQSEVTERVLLRLRTLGVRLVVDDFGTGFSALGYLRRHPVTGVKVDRGFVDGLGRDPEDEEIVRAVVAMSCALGLTVVAEGVETPAQCAVLAALGVVLGQGYLWGRPADPAAFAARHGRAPAPAGRLP